MQVPHTTTVQKTMQEASLTMIYSSLGGKHTAQATRTVERIPHMAKAAKLCDMLELDLFFTLFSNQTFLHIEP